MRRAMALVLACVVVEWFGGCGAGSGGTTPPAQISVRVSPMSVSVNTGNQQQFTSSVTGTTNTGVTWGVAGGAADGTISAGGLYTAPASVPNPPQVTVTATSVADETKSGTATVTVQSSANVQVFPATVTLQVGGQQIFSANVTGLTNPAVLWSVLGGSANGQIGGTGNYIAPSAVPNPAQVTIKATSVMDSTKFGTATVTVIAAVPSITVMPNPASVSIFTTQQFVPFTENLPSTAVTWQVNGVTGGSKQTGFISSAGVYVAPGAVPTKSNGQGDSTPTTVTVTAVSQVNSSVSGSAIVTVFPQNQDPEGSQTMLGTSGSNQKDQQTGGGTITCCGGTLGSLVTRGGTQYILSNNHVLARTDLGTIGSGAVTGDNIIEPGLIDTNCGQGAFATVANLSQFYNLESGTAPKIDAAIAQIQPGAVDPTGKILYLGDTADANGVPVAAAPHAGAGLAETSALLSRAVAKSGRTTGLTCSTIFSISTSTSVQYQKGCGTGTTFSENYSNQVAVTGGGFSAPGDSGSLIVTQDTADAVALLFAGSDQESVGNPVGAVLNFFQSGGNAVTFAGGGTHKVIGCTLPTAPAGAKTLASSAGGASTVGIEKEVLQKATEVRDAKAGELMGYAGVQAVGVGESLDEPGAAAIIIFVRRGEARAEVPAVVGGVRTRFVEADEFAERGVLTAEQRSTTEQSGATTESVYGISDAEFERAKSVHEAHVDEWMSKEGVQGMGIGSSADAPGEASMVIYVIRGMAHEAIPAVMEGVRTRVRESSRFRAGFGDGNAAAGGCAVPVSAAKSRKPGANTKDKASLSRQ